MKEKVRCDICGKERDKERIRYVERYIVEKGGLAPDSAPKSLAVCADNPACIRKAETYLEGLCGGKND